MDVLLQRQEGERTYSEMFKRYGKRVFIAMSAQGLAQLNGINVISYYAPYVFESAGWIGHDAILMTGINGITYFLSTIPPWYIVDSWGRRPILLSGAIAMAISLSLISYFLYLDIPATPVLVVVFVMVYNAAFGYSWGPIPWLYPPEILPLKIRSKGASLSTATNWAFNWLVGLMTPILQELIHWRLYLLHAFFCTVSFVVGKLSPSVAASPTVSSRLAANSRVKVYFLYPETCGVRLEDMDILFGDATAAMGTPATAGTPSMRAEVDSLVRAASPVPTLDIRGRPQFGSSSAIPGLDIDPPSLGPTGAKARLPTEEQGSRSRGRGWFSRLTGRVKSPGGSGGGYAPLGQGDD